MIRMSSRGLNGEREGIIKKKVYLIRLFEIHFRQEDLKFEHSAKYTTFNFIMRNIMLNK